MELDMNKDFHKPEEVKILYTKLFINGEWVDSKEGKKMQVIDPARGKMICEVSQALEEDVNEAVKAARNSFPIWKDMSPLERSKIMWKWAELMERDRNYIAALEAIDNGKPYTMCRDVDIPLSIQQFRFFGGWADKLDGRTLCVPGDYVAYVEREPIGVCGQIIPWNFPMLMFSWKVAPALACGNCVVIKTSEHTPLSALYVAQLGKEAGLPNGVLNVLSGFGKTCGEPLALHMDVNKISFTGSTVVGHRIMWASSKSNLKSVSLELGGKSPLIIFPDSKDRLKWAVEVCCQGIFFNQGQVCCASSRVFVHEDIYRDFLKIAKEFAEKRIVGDPFMEGVEQGAQNSKRQYDKIVKYLSWGVREGGKVLTGGKVIKNVKGCEGGFFIEPTIFYDCKDSMKIVKDEIFGPVSCVMKFKTVEEVVQRANKTVYGLAAGIITKEIDLAMKVTRRLNAGTVWINCWNVFGANMPFGGFKGSGFGKDSGIYALRNYTKEKVVIMSVPGLKRK